MKDERRRSSQVDVIRSINLSISVSSSTEKLSFRYLIQPKSLVFGFFNNREARFSVSSITERFGIRFLHQPKKVVFGPYFLQPKSILILFSMSLQSQVYKNELIMSLETDTCLPVLINENEYSQWRDRFINFLERKQNGDYMVRALTYPPFERPVKIIPATANTEQSTILKPIDEYNEEESLKYNGERIAKSNLILALPNHIYKRVDCYKNNLMLMWTHLEKIMLGSVVKKTIIQQTVSVESNEQKVKKLESENFELKRNLSDLEKQLVANKVEFESEKKIFSKKFSDFSKKCYEEKKSFELKCIKLSQQISDFEKVLILEREKFEKEKKAIEQKNVGFFKELSGQRTDSEKEFEEERLIFENEIKKLTSKLSELSATGLKEQKTKSEFKTKIDLLEKERDIFASKIKDLEKSISSSNHKYVSSKRSINSFNQIRRTNLFFDEYLDGSDYYPRRKSFKNEKLVWMKKSVKDDKTDELKEKNSCVHVHKAKKNKTPNVQDPHLNVKKMASKHNSLGPVPHRSKRPYSCMLASDGY
ncbi:hypothetical protein L6452_37695 [Arctium lappa]|uniref:Uncharacterized protein n=1 Tax=Arctium lappa TaxID=4217 RepID=A0ACB8Y7U5_ARCLA|nr:hypothetical protein L6452_37695 [Arctium lappa]